MTRLEPKFWRVALWVGMTLLAGAAVGYFLQGIQQHKWWTLGYILSFAVPLAVVPVLVWYLFVPSWFEYSETEISLRTLMCQGTYAWNMLDSYGPGRGVFMIQFRGDSGAYQIFSRAYSRDEWTKFKQFLETRFPDRKCSFSIGGRLMR